MQGPCSMGDIVPSLLPPHRLPAVCPDAFSPAEAGNRVPLSTLPRWQPPGPSPDPHSQAAPGAAPDPSCHGGKQRSFAEPCAPLTLGKPLYFAINEIPRPLQAGNTVSSPTWVDISSIQSKRNLGRHVVHATGKC